MVSTKETPIVVKFLPPGTTQRSGADKWIRQFPGGAPVWGRCRFVFDLGERAYDWLAVYNDLPVDAEKLACPPDHTILMTTEPSSIKIYGKRFVRQFGCVLTSQEAWAVSHPHAIRSQPALRWFYGAFRTPMQTFDEILDKPPLAKSRVISTVCSSKQQRHTLHHRRYHFIRELEKLVPELDVYGRTTRVDKTEALDAYRYCVAVENAVCDHHWTEYLGDSFLACCLPFYYGAPNAAEYFPAGSFIPIDIFDAQKSARIIRAAIESGEYEKRLPLIMEARRRVLREYNTFAVLSKLIEERHDAQGGSPAGGTILSRHALRSSSLLDAGQELFMKIRGRLHHLRRPR